MKKRIETDHKDNPRPGTCLLYSGGMDCLMLAQVYRPQHLLYIRTGSDYEKVEADRMLGRVVNQLVHEGTQVHTLGMEFLRTFERDDGICPSRNAYFTLAAANYADTVMMGTVYGDRTTDKDEEYGHRMERLMDHLYMRSHWCAGRNVRLCMPAYNHTKTELVAEFLQHGGKPEDLLESWSCYGTGPVHCGQCKPCFRKWVALENNGITPEAPYWKTHPSMAPWLTDLLPKMDGTYRGREDHETRRALAAWRTDPCLAPTPT